MPDNVLHHLYIVNRRSFQGDHHLQSRVWYRLATMAVLQGLTMPTRDGSGPRATTPPAPAKGSPPVRPAGSHRPQIQPRAQRWRRCTRARRQRAFPAPWNMLGRNDRSIGGGYQRRHLCVAGQRNSTCRWWSSVQPVASINTLHPLPQVQRCSEDHSFPPHQAARKLAPRH
jgi:hypothetical protein